MFDITRERAAGWSIDEECLWSYFFTDTDRAKLLTACRELEAEGFRVVGFLEPTPEEDDQVTVFLRLDRVETHTVDTLLALNERLSAFALAKHLGSYDGMEAAALEAQ